MKIPRPGGWLDDCTLDQFREWCVTPNCGHYEAAEPTASGPACRSEGTDTSRCRDFKARCLALMERVRESGVEYVITKHGRPVAKLVPYRSPRGQGLFGSMKGTVLTFERPFDPIESDYDIDGE